MRNQKDKSKIKNDFEKRLIKFSVATLKLCAKIRKDPNFWVLSDQLIRSATSIGANIVEAKSASSRRDYVNFFQIALKSTNETKYWLIIIKETSPQLETKIESMIKETKEIANIIASSIITLKGKRNF